MLHVFRYLILLWISLSLSGRASEFDLKEYVKTDVLINHYTVALLDRSLIAYNDTLEAEDIPPEVSSFILTSVKSELCKVQAFPRSKDCPKHFIVQLMRKRTPLPSAQLTEILLKNSSKVISNSIDENELEFAASIILFPVDDGPDRMLAYLLGNWLSLLKTTTRVPSFGLKVVTSIGVASSIEEKDEKLCNIRTLDTETCRNAKPMRDTKKTHNGFGGIADFEIESSRDGLTKVTLKPVKNWGTAVLEGDDNFQFKLKKKNKKNNAQQKEFTNCSVMYVVAKNIYEVYREGSVHKDFIPYLDEPVTEQATVKGLNQQIQENWAKYFKDETLYMHWTFWFRVRGIENLSEILEGIKTGGYNEITSIKGQDYTAAQLVRSLPIAYSPKLGGIKSFYYLDRGFWHHIHAARFEVIKKSIGEKTVKQADLFLPDYHHQAGSDNDDYKELAYNKAAVEEMQDQDQIREVLLLDRKNVPLGDRDDKFEFADILMQQKNGEYYLIHVKRERAGAFDHHRTQAERCALFLGENLDRSALPGLFSTHILDTFYDNYIELPAQSKKKKQTQTDSTRPRSSTFRTKFKIDKKSVSEKKDNDKKKKDDIDFSERIQNGLKDVKLPVRKLIRNIVAEDKIIDLINQFEPYDDVLTRCLDAIEDYISYSEEGLSVDQINNAIKSKKVPSTLIKITAELLNDMLAFLKKHPSFTENHQGLLLSKDRKNINIVLAIIGDGTGNEEFHNQQLWGIDQTRRVVEGQHINFKVVYIKEKEQEASSTDTSADSSQSSSTDRLRNDLEDSKKGKEKIKKEVIKLEPKKALNKLDKDNNSRKSGKDEITAKSMRRTAQKTTSGDRKVSSGKLERRSKVNSSSSKLTRAKSLKEESDESDTASDS